MEEFKGTKGKWVVEPAPNMGYRILGSSGNAIEDAYNSDMESLFIALLYVPVEYPAFLQAFATSPYCCSERMRSLIFNKSFIFTPF